MRFAKLNGESKNGSVTIAMWWGGMGWGGAVFFYLLFLSHRDIYHDLGTCVGGYHSVRLFEYW